MNGIILEVCRKIQSAGGKAYIVGGSVRDFVMNKKDFKDCDIEVFGLDGNQLKSALETISGFNRAQDVGKSFGVIKFSSGGVDFDIALPRRERKVGEGYRGFDVSIDPNMSTYEASLRRDFTMNSIMFDPLEKEIIDHHSGIFDIHQGIIRHTSDRFDEDPLRVLRCMQFSSRTGFDAHPETAQRSKNLYHEYKTIHKDRIWSEWKKWALGKSPDKGLSFLDESGWIGHYPELAALKGCQQDHGWHPEGDVWIHTKMVVREASRVATERNFADKDSLVLVFAALCHDLGKPLVTEIIDGRVRALGHCTAGEALTTPFLESIGTPNDIIEKVVPLVVSHLDFAGIKEPTKRNVNRLANRLYPANIYLWDALVEADKSGRDPLPRTKINPAWLRIAEEIKVSEDKVNPVFLGRHLIEKGYTPCREFGNILKKAVEIQIEHDINDPESIFDFLKENGTLESLTVNHEQYKKNECKYASPQLQSLP